MAYIKGKKVILTFLKDGEYSPFLCATGCTLTINTDFVDTRTVGDGPWEKIEPQSKSYSISLSGLIELQETQPVCFWLIENFDMQMLPVMFRMEFIDESTSLQKNATGKAYIVTSVVNGVATGFATSSFELRGTGALVISDTTSECSATIGEITIGAGDPDIGANASVNYEGVSGAARLEYSVDGGPRETIFGPAASGFFYLFGLAEGPHTIDIWVVCENGNDGEMNSLAFEITDGEPGETCEAPSGLMVEISGSLATISWTASVSTPANGYKFELIFKSTGNLAQEGETMDTSVAVTVLEGVEYIFKVKSLCEAGVSESAFVEIEFGAVEPPACNVPGTPVMSAIDSNSATATWTAPSPAPAGGYAWEVRQGVTVVDSGTTSGLSVNIVGLLTGTSYQFRVKSLCGGGNESGWNSADFTTTGSSNVDWALDEGFGNGSLQIKRNGLTIVNVTTGQTGSFTAQGGDSIQVTLTAATGDLTVDDITAGSTIISDTGSGTITGTFAVTSAHNYSITAQPTS